MGENKGKGIFSVFFLFCFEVEFKKVIRFDPKENGRIVFAGFEFIKLPIFYVMSGYCKFTDVRVSSLSVVNFSRFSCVRSTAV